MFVIISDMLLRTVGDSVLLSSVGDSVELTFSSVVEGVSSVPFPERVGELVAGVTDGDGTEVAVDAGRGATEVAVVVGLGSVSDGAMVRFG